MSLKGLFWEDNNFTVLAVTVYGFVMILLVLKAVISLSVFDGLLAACMVVWLLGYVYLRGL